MLAEEALEIPHASILIAGDQYPWGTREVLAIGHTSPLRSGLCASSGLALRLARPGTHRRVANSPAGHQ